MGTQAQPQQPPTTITTTSTSSSAKANMPPSNKTTLEARATKKAQGESTSSSKVDDGEGKEVLACSCKNLNFSYGKVQVIHDLNMQLPKGSRCLLLGDNGAGKTTLLKVLGGKKMCVDGDVRVLGLEAVFTPSLNLRRSYLSCNWGKTIIPFAGMTAVTADIAVKDMMRSLQDQFPERRKLLYKLLQINGDWRMHRVSDGQRRRVQIMLQLLRPFEILLLDEVTTDLDIVTRMDLMAFLKNETETRGVTIIYATHIFDGLDSWPSHVAYLAAGHLKFFDTKKTLLKEYDGSFQSSSSSTTDGMDVDADDNDDSSSGRLRRVIGRWIRRDRGINYTKYSECLAAQAAATAIKPDGTAGGYSGGRSHLFA